MGTVIKIEVDGNTKKTNIVYIKFDDSEAGKDAIAKHSNNFAYNNQAVPIVPVLTKIKIKPGKPSLDTSLCMYSTQGPRFNIEKCCY